MEHGDNEEIPAKYSLKLMKRLKDAYSKKEELKKELAELTKGNENKPEQKDNQVSSDKAEFNQVKEKCQNVCKRLLRNLICSYADPQVRKICELKIKKIFENKKQMKIMKDMEIEGIKIEESDLLNWESYLEKIKSKYNIQ